MAFRFWVPVVVTGAVDNGSGLIRLTMTLNGGGVTPTATWATGDHVNVSAVGGVTNANGSWTITVIDANEIDLQGSTFAGTYTSGGVVQHDWTSTNTANWAQTTTGTAGGFSVPGGSDIATFDGASGGGIVKVAVGSAGSTITLQSIVCGAHTGTLDFSGHNNNVTLTGTGTAWFNGGGSGTRTFNAGSGTWTLTGGMANINAWSFATVTGLTAIVSNCSIVMSNTSTMGTTFAGGGQTYGTVTFNTHANKGGYSFSGANFIATLNIGAPNVVYLSTSSIQTVTNLLDVAGTAGNYILISSNSNVTASTLAATAATTGATLDYCMLRGVIVTGTGTHSATNTIDLGGNTGWETLTPPAAGGGGGGSGVIGG